MSRDRFTEKDENGKLLPDEKRLTQYGKLLRSTSLDELPEIEKVNFGEPVMVEEDQQTIPEVVGETVTWEENQ